MSIKKEQILLGSKDVITKEDVDNFINIELTRNYNEIKPDRLDNVFDLTQQYDTERNNSLKFCVYGLVESKYVNTDNLTIIARTNSGDTIFSPKISTEEGVVISSQHTFKTIPLSSSQKLSQNIFDTNKSSYFFLFELENSILTGGTREMIFTINEPNKHIFEEVKIPIILFDTDNEFVPYGTETTDLNIDGSLTSVDNNFPFFYDRHWVKNNLFPSRIAKVFFSASTFSFIENITNGIAKVPVTLNFPSKFGREKVQVVLDKDLTKIDPNKDFAFTSQTLSWEIGEQTKYFDVKIINDLFTEPDESLIFKLKNLKNVELSGNNDSVEFKILNDDIPATIDFVHSEERIIENDVFIKINLRVGEDVKVSGQHIDLTVDIIEPKQFTDLIIASPTTAVIGEDFTIDFGNAGNDVPKKSSSNNLSTGTPSVFVAIPTSSSVSNIDKTIFGITSAITANDIILANSSSTNINKLPIATTITVNTDKTLITSGQGKGETVKTKTIPIPIGTKKNQIISTTIRLFRNLQYNLDKKIALKLENPTQNIVIGTQRPTYILHIQDNINPKFTNFIIPGNIETGEGTFRVRRNNFLNQPFEWFLNNDIEKDSPDGFFNDFSYKLEIFNKGVDVPFNGKMIKNEERIFFKEFTAGTEGFEIELPANDNFNNDELFYEKLNYLFMFSTDKVEFTSDSNLFDFFSFLQKNLIVQTDTYKTIEVSTQGLSAGDKNKKQYFLTTIVDNLIANQHVDDKCTNTLNNKGTEVKINGMVFLPEDSGNFIKSKEDALKLIADIALNPSTENFNKLKKFIKVDLDFSIKNIFELVKLVKERISSKDFSKIKEIKFSEQPFEILCSLTSDKLLPIAK